MTHKFTYKYPDSKTSVTVDVDSDANLYEMIEAFEDYLKACGYTANGHVEWVENK